ncbi:hypothetical protein E4U21_001611 [Claviceps maximensis]|nr:hypothetical protein E4U21_001611 [Claviceps maximensis]
MSKICLSEENIRRLKELGYGCAANPIELPPTIDRFRYEQPRSQRQMEEFPMHSTISILKTSSNATALLDATLGVFAWIYLQFPSTTAVVVPQLQPTFNKVYDAESFKVHDERAQNRHEVDRLVLAQHDLVQVLVSATICKLDFTAEAALASLLLLHYTTDSVQLSTLSLAHTAAYTNSHNHWTTKPAALFANCILDFQLTKNGTRHLISDMLASNINKPGVQEYINSDISESSVINLPTSTSLKCIDQGRRFATVLEWVLQTVETEYVAGHWHCFVPFLIDLTESHEMTAKTKALQLIITFVAKCPAMTLFTTGIDRLLENAIFPLLYFVPPLSSEDDSVILLATAFQALVDIAVKDPALPARSRRRLLDKLLREGLLQIHQHALEYVKVTTILLRSTTKVASFLGIFAIKHISVSIAQSKRVWLMLMMERVF